jgi:hypothetical protein
MKYAIRIANAPFPVWVEAIYPELVGKIRSLTGLGVSYFYTASPRHATLYNTMEVVMELKTMKDPTEVITEDELQVYVIMDE